ncbi:MAG: YiiX/YebB-like N1pC/P60 family cysteine hydrolase [Saprospiraceae bacterium]|jgi:uncharacterized protein YycO|nr:YiiX/YebB-like N1pC/P60 family cysteine hydrolase [Saprospiraceae bacterium]
MKKLIYFCLLLFLFFGCEIINSQNTNEKLAPQIQKVKIWEAFKLKPGDLLFQDSDCGLFCDAIEQVTFGKNGAKLSHVGMVVRNDTTGRLVVLEAISEGVVETNFDVFFSRSFDKNEAPKILVGRLKSEFSNLIKPAILKAKSLSGKPYDEVFDINNDAYYCSELIYHSFKKANDDQAIFQLRPMTYKDPKTNQTFNIWEDYFKELDIEIPEGQPGLNPGSMSRSIFLEIVHAYGTPQGWRLPK